MLGRFYRRHSGCDASLFRDQSEIVTITYITGNSTCGPNASMIPSSGRDVTHRNRLNE